jgi:hypothetical protein
LGGKNNTMKYLHLVNAKNEIPTTTEAFLKAASSMSGAVK